MTLSKLSLRNARRQARDYLVYFVTVVMAAALLYSFNGLVFSREVQQLSHEGSLNQMDGCLNKKGISRMSLLYKLSSAM